MTTDDSPDDARPVGDPGAAATPGSPAAPTPDEVPDEVPDEETLEAIATPATVRHAPRFGAFVRTGVLLGALIGWLPAILFSGTTGEGRTGAIILSTLAGAGFGALLAAGVAALADRRSVRGMRTPPGARPGAGAGRPPGGSPTV